MPWQISTAITWLAWEDLFQVICFQESRSFCSSSRYAIHVLLWQWEAHFLRLVLCIHRNQPGYGIQCRYEGNYRFPLAAMCMVNWCCLVGSLHENSSSDIIYGSTGRLHPGKLDTKWVPVTKKLNWLLTYCTDGVLLCTLGNVEGVCSSTQPDHFTCPQGRVNYNSAIFWGGMSDPSHFIRIELFLTTFSNGPSRLYNVGRLYSGLLHMF